MKNFVKKFIENKYVNILINIITLSGQKRFIISSMTYFLTISLVPLSTLIYVFTSIINGRGAHNPIDLFIPIEDKVIDKIFILSNNPYIIFFTLVISLYIASKGLLNYYYFLTKKYNLKLFKKSIIIDNLYISLITLLMCLIYSSLRTVFFFLNTDNVFVGLLLSIIKFFSTFFSILILNYFLLKKQIQIKKLLLGSFISSIMLYVINALYLKYANFFIKEMYYGVLTQVIVLLLYLYFICYSFLIGNEISFLLYKKKCRSTFYS